MFISAAVFGQNLSIDELVLLDGKTRYDSLLQLSTNKRENLNFFKQHTVFLDNELDELLRDTSVLEFDPVSERDREYLETPLPSRMLWADCSSYLPDNIFVKSDRMSMAHSLEVRAPFVEPARGVAGRAQ